MSRPRKPINHGTESGYVIHRRRSEDPCQACREGRLAGARKRNGIKADEETIGYEGGWYLDGVILRPLAARPVENSSSNRPTTWENKGGPEGALTPVVPALDGQSSLEGSAHRGP